jgi:hypothetical protein
VLVLSDTKNLLSFQKVQLEKQAALPIWVVYCKPPTPNSNIGLPLASIAVVSRLVHELVTLAISVLLSITIN